MRVEIIDGMTDRLRKGWCRHYYANTADGTPVEYDDNQAVSWCLVGALRLESDDDKTEMYSVSEEIRNHIDGFSLATWNDARGRTQGEVLELLAKVRQSVSNDRSSN